MPIITDAGLTHDNTKKYLSVGETVLLKAQSDIVIDFEVLGESGPTVMRRGNSVYMCGADDYGTLYSVYKFLEYQIGFKAYATDCVYYDYYNQLKLLDFNYQYVPTIGKTNAHGFDIIGVNEIDNYATDGLHVNEDGHALIAKAILSAMKNTFGISTNN